MVDRQENTYTADELRCWKADTEARLNDALAQTIPNVTFTELEVVTRSLVNSLNTLTTSLSLIPPRDKIDRNNLTAKSERLITLGMVQTKQVQEFVETMHGLDSTFIDRLTSGFVSAYQQRRNAGLEGDALFEEMRLFSTQGEVDILAQSAGLAVLVYLFERCEVFEQ